MTMLSQYRRVFFGFLASICDSCRNAETNRNLSLKSYNCFRVVLNIYSNNYYTFAILYNISDLYLETICCTREIIHNFENALLYSHCAAFTGRNKRSAYCYFHSLRFTDSLKTITSFYTQLTLKSKEHGQMATCIVIIKTVLQVVFNLMGVITVGMNLLPEAIHVINVLRGPIRRISVKIIRDVLDVRKAHINQILDLLSVGVVGLGHSPRQPTRRLLLCVRLAARVLIVLEELLVVLNAH